MNKNEMTLVNCTILTMDEKDTFFPDGKIVIEENKIVEIGPSDKVVSRGNIKDMKDKLVLPGFINTHTHSPSPLFRSMADDLKLMDWLKTRIWPAEKYLTEELAYWGAGLNCLELLESGVTTFADQYFYSTHIASAVIQLGLRGFIAPTIFSGESPETGNTLQAGVDFIEKYKGKEEQTLIYPCIGPHAPYSCSKDVLESVADIALHNKLLVHIHISETLDENTEIYEKTGLTPTQYIESTGIFENKVLSAHSIHLNEKDIEIFKNSNVAVSYNPVSNLKLVSGIMPLKAFNEKNILVSLGTDGAQSNNSLDILRDLKTGALIQKQKYEDATFFSSREALRMITIKGAEALGMEKKIGSLEKGKLADIITLDLRKSNLCPIHKGSIENLYSMVVYSACGSDVSDVIVNGNILMENRLVKVIDRDRVRKEAQKSAEVLMKNAGLIL
ncbi:MAG: amidohydrolase [Clostridia bacterium]